MRKENAPDAAGRVYPQGGNGCGVREANSKHTAGVPRILHVITRLVAGGAQDSTIAACEHMARKGFDVALACAPEKARVKEARARGIDVIEVPGFRRELSPWNDLRALVRLDRVVRAGCYDVVHTHTSKAGVLGRIAARCAGVPVVVHSPHGSIFDPTYYGPVALGAIARVERFAGRFADRIIPLSRGGMDDYLQRRLAPRRKFVLVYTGLDEDRFLAVNGEDPTARAALGLPAGVPVIGMIARLTPEKGHDLALRAFSLVLRREPEARLLIVGEGGSRTAIEEDIRRLGLEKRVVLAGYRRDVTGVLGAVDISLHSSHMDGLPRSLIEAMLAARPVVATRVGGIPEAVIDGESALLVEPEDVEAIAAALLRLIGDRALARRLGNNARKAAASRFSTERMVDEWLRVYRDVAREKGMDGMFDRGADARVVPCPVCGAGGQERLTRVVASPIRMHTWLVRCRCCRTQYVSPAPGGVAEQGFYRDRYYESEPGAVWEGGRREVFLRFLRAVESRVPGRGRLLDVGCGNGAFLSLAAGRSVPAARAWTWSSLRELRAHRRCAGRSVPAAREWTWSSLRELRAHRRCAGRGWSVSGVDISRSAVRDARARGLDVMESDLAGAGLPVGSFDAVTAWNVLDQVSRPAAELDAVVRVLKPGGTVALRVSNVVFQAALHRAALVLCGGRCRNCDPAVFHNVAFSPRTVRLFLRRAGFEDVRVTNSPLSEDVPGAHMLLGRHGARMARVLVSLAASVVCVLTFGALLVGPSLLVIARKPGGKTDNST